MMKVRSIAMLVLSMHMMEVKAQHLDSVHVFRSNLETRCSSARAEANAWRCQRSRTAFLSIAGSELHAINEALASARPDKHRPAELDVAGLGFGYSNGAMHAFAITSGAEKVIDLTNRREFAISDLADRLKLKAMLFALGL